MISTGPSVRLFLRFLIGRRTLLILAPLSRGVMVVFVNVIKPQGLEPLQFPTKFRSPSRGVWLLPRWDSLPLNTPAFAGHTQAQRMLRDLPYQLLPRGHQTLIESTP